MGNSQTSYPANPGNYEKIMERKKALETINNLSKTDNMYHEKSCEDSAPYKSNWKKWTFTGSVGRYISRFDRKGFGSRSMYLENTLSNEILTYDNSRDKCSSPSHSNSCNESLPKESTPRPTCHRYESVNQCRELSNSPPSTNKTRYHGVHHQAVSGHLRKGSTASAAILSLKRKKYRAPRPPMSMPVTPLTHRHDLSHQLTERISAKVTRNQSLTISVNSSTSSELTLGPKKRPAPAPPARLAPIQTMTSCTEEGCAASSSRYSAEMDHSRLIIALPPPDYDGVGGVGTIPEHLENDEEFINEHNTIRQEKENPIEAPPKLNSLLQNDVRAIAMTHGIKPAIKITNVKPKTPDQDFKDDLTRAYLEREIRRENGNLAQKIKTNEICTVSKRFFEDHSNKWLERDVPIDHRSEGSGASNPTPPISQKHQQTKDWIPIDDIDSGSDTDDDHIITGHSRHMTDPKFTNTALVANEQTKLFNRIRINNVSESPRYKKREQFTSRSLKKIKKTFQSAMESIGRSSSKVRKRTSVDNVLKRECPSSITTDLICNISDRNVQVIPIDIAETQQENESELKRLRNIERKYLKMREEKSSLEKYDSSRSSDVDETHQHIERKLSHRISPQGEENVDSCTDSSDVEIVTKVNRSSTTVCGKTRTSKLDTVSTDRVKSNPVYDSDGENIQRENHMTESTIPVQYTSGSSLQSGAGLPSSVQYVPQFYQSPAPFMMLPSTCGMYGYQQPQFIPAGLSPHLYHMGHVSQTPMTAPMYMEAQQNLSTFCQPPIGTLLTRLSSTNAAVTEGSVKQNTNNNVEITTKDSKTANKANDISDHLQDFTSNYGIANTLSDTSCVSLIHDDVKKPSYQNRDSENTNDDVISRHLPHTSISAISNNTKYASEHTTITELTGTSTIVEETPCEERKKCSIDCSNSFEQDGFPTDLTLKEDIAETFPISQESSSTDTELSLEKNKSEQELLKNQIKLLSARGYKPMKWKPVSVRTVLYEHDTGIERET